ncbi:MAG: 3D domain-containing protein [Dehalobacterium sp.]
MKKVILMLVMELILLYPTEEVNQKTVIENPVPIVENFPVINKDEETKVLPVQEAPALKEEADEEIKVMPVKEQPTPPKEVDKRNESKNAARHEERKTVQVFEATAYCSCVKCCGKSDGITKSGVKVHKGTLAVDPRVIPLGTKVYIEGMGWFIAEDTGNFSGKRIDIYMETHEQALQFGRRKVNVII